MNEKTLAQRERARISPPWSEFCISFLALDRYAVNRGQFGAVVIKHIRTCRYCRIRLHVIGADYGWMKEEIDRRLEQDWKMTRSPEEDSYRDSLPQDIAPRLESCPAGMSMLFAAVVIHARPSDPEHAFGDDFRRLRVYSLHASGSPPARPARWLPQITPLSTTGAPLVQPVLFHNLGVDRALWNESDYVMPHFSAATQAELHVAKQLAALNLSGLADFQKGRLPVCLDRAG